ncbi:MAG: acyl carrier protein [Clostridia bacterium]|jgi:acyl carrier protein|nr:acyl carrier protein [Clostridia bacterium]MBQ8567518.1 acyl carrier protein [Clostridia bacterium]
MFEKLRDILVEELSIEADAITMEAELANDLGINSLELADLVLLCEDTFGVEFDENDMHKFITVGDVVEFLNANAK